MWFQPTTYDHVHSNEEGYHGYLAFGCGNSADGYFWEPKMAITSKGYVGFGTTSPTSKVEVVGNIYLVDGGVLNKNRGSRPTLSSTGGDIAWEGETYHQGNKTKHWLFVDGDGEDEEHAYFNEGNVGIGTSNPSEKLEVNGNIKATSFIATSDARHKENICDLENSLEKICSIRGVNFNFKDDENQKHAGILAQEVDSIIPEAINKKDDEKWSANYNTFVGYLIESVKTLKKENDDQNVKIENLESKLEAQGQLIQKLMEKINIT